MWQTLESYGSSYSNSTPAARSRSIAAATSGTRSATEPTFGENACPVVDVQQPDPVRRRPELHPEPLRLPDSEAGIADPELVPRALVRAQTERLDVEPPRPLEVSRRNAD